MEDNQFLDDQAGHGKVGEVASGLELFVPLREGFADLISKRGRKHDGLGEILISPVVLLDGLESDDYLFVFAGYSGEVFGVNHHLDSVSGLDLITDDPFIQIHCLAAKSEYHQQRSVLINSWAAPFVC